MSRHRKLNPAARFMSRPLKEIMKHTYDFPVTFVGAPPGYGKTVLIRSLRDDDSTYHINMHFDGTEYFFDCLNGAFRENWPDMADVFKQIAHDVRDAAAGGAGAGVENFIYMKADAALQSIRRSGKRIRVVIDNFHVLSRADTIAQMLCRIACESNGRIFFVIASRVNYFTRESKEVESGVVCLIVPEMLLLDENETAEYFKLCGVPVSVREAALLCQRTGGWILILSMVVNEYLRSGSIAFASGPVRYIKYVYDMAYSMAEFRDEIDFAGVMCVMKSFTAGQAERFSGRSDAADMIARMRNHNIYLLYDVENGAYGFIPPFREYMLMRYFGGKEELLKERMKAAGDTVAADGEFVRAADYYYNAGEYELMMSAIESGGHIGRDEEKRENYIKYYRECPREVRSRYHLAMLYMAWRFFNFGEMKLYKEASLEFLGDLYSDKRLSVTEKDTLLCDYSLFCAMTDFADLDKVKQDYSNALAVFDGVKRTKHSVIPRTYGVTAVMKLLYNRGKVEDALHMIGEIAEMGNRLIGDGWNGISYECRAEAALMRLDFDMAEIYVNSAGRECGRSPEKSAGVRLCIAFLQTRLAIVRGEYDPAAGPLKEFTEREHNAMVAPLKKTIDVCMAWVNIQMGDDDEIADWLKSGEFSDVGMLYPAMPSIYLTHMYVLFSMKKYNKLISCGELFFGKEPLTENLVIRETVYLLLAAAWNEIGRTYNARECLDEALQLAEETENLAAFLFYGETLMPLIRQITAKYSGTVEKILKAAEKYIQNREKCRSAGRRNTFRDLTKRESQIAECAAKGMINREIAETLGISENTVKTMMKRVFSKFDITSRRQLAAKLYGEK